MLSVTHNEQATSEDNMTSSRVDLLKNKGKATYQVCPVHVIQDSEHDKARHYMPVQFSGDPFLHLLVILKCADTCKRFTHGCIKQNYQDSECASV